MRTYFVVRCSVSVSTAAAAVAAAVVVSASGDVLWERMRRMHDVIVLSI